MMNTDTGLLVTQQEKQFAEVVDMIVQHRSSYVTSSQ